MNSATPISLTRLRVGYQGRPVLEDLDLVVDPGERVVLLGPNGAGKTTLFRCLLGLVKPTCGHIELFGQDPADPGLRHRLLARIGASIESPGLPSHTRPIEYLEHFARLNGLRSPRECARDALRRWELPSHMEANRLSLGQRQRLQVARCLIHTPSLAVLDEPAANLDPSAQESFWELLDRWQATTGSTLLVSTHHLEEAFRHGRRCVLLGEGRKLADGPPQSILSSVSGSRRIQLARPSTGTDIQAIVDRHGLKIELIGDPSRESTHWRWISTGTSSEQPRLLKALVEADLPVEAFGQDGITIQESYRILLGRPTRSDPAIPAPFEPTNRFAEIPNFAGAAMSSARLHAAGLSRERRILVPMLFLTAMLAASALWVLPDSLPTPDFFLPMLALASLLPAGLSGGIASDLVAGERERKSLETLLCAPASPSSLLFGKALSIFVPALLLSWISIVAVWSALASRSMAPSPISTIALALGFAPMTIAFSLCVGVWVSSRSQTVRAAAQMSALITVPLVALSQAIPFLTPRGFPEALAWPCAGACLGLFTLPIVWRLSRSLRPESLLR